MYYCNNCTIENGEAIGEPTEKALFEFALNKVGNKNFKVEKEIPFDSTRKMMTKIINRNGYISYTKGAPDYLIKKCKFIKINGKICDFDANFQEKIKKETPLFSAFGVSFFG